MTSLLLLLISAAAPWVVHIAPPRQRLLALVAMVAVFLLFGIFVRNPLTAWVFWVGLVAGVVSVVGLSSTNALAGLARRHHDDLDTGTGRRR